MQLGGGEQKATSHPVQKPSWWMLAVVLGLAAFLALGVWWLGEVTIQSTIEASNAPEPIVSTKSTATPQLRTEVLVKNRDHVWEMGFLPTGEMLFTERSKGVLSYFKDGSVHTIAKIDDVFAVGEAGLLGLTVDPDFTKNRFIYTCMNSKRGGPDVRVARWKLRTDLSGFDARTDIVTGISSNKSGRHSGCRLGFGPDDYLWIGTGDSANNHLTFQRPQDPKSLNGKVLRVDRSGKGAPGNLGGKFDARIFNYGHRNVQGLAFFPSERGGVAGVSVEHGSDRDDEVNLLIKGNFGWDPDPGYTEKNVPMTDTKKFPHAIDALWSSGFPTQAPSGATFLTGAKWKAWNGALAVAFLKDQKLKIIFLDGQNKLVKEEDVLKDTFGRLRSARLGPDGDLYLSTDNGDNKDIIVRVTPY